MYINPSWRILTVGDGDLSFSLALQRHHRPAQLTATIYDPLATLTSKYGNDNYLQLVNSDCQVLTGFDVTDPLSWRDLNHQQFDLIIFQFPLIPAFGSQALFQQQQAGANTLNRRLLRAFLLNSHNHFLDPNGAQLAVITSKDVKPYREWNIEHSLALNSELNYLGSMTFNAADFPGYQVRNVDRDKFVKDTQGISYFWSPQAMPAELEERLTPPQYTGEHYCPMCRVGPFGNPQDQQSHQLSKRHLRMAGFEQLWLDDLNQSG